MFRTRRESRILGRLEEMGRDVAHVTGQMREVSERLGMAEQYEYAKKELTDLQITLDKVREDHEREKREIEHKIGLHRDKVKHEIKASKTDAELAVREEALKDAQKRFEEHMEFQRERFEKEIEGTRHLMEQILTRLPVVNVERTYKTVEHVGEYPPASPTARVEIERGDE